MGNSIYLFRVSMALPELLNAVSRTRVLSLAGVLQRAQECGAAKASATSLGSSWAGSKASRLKTLFQLRQKSTRTELARSGLFPALQRSIGASCLSGAGCDD
jgi:hypothetical protein